MRDEELFLIRLFGGGYGAWFDPIAIIAFFMIGMVAFLAPVLGYRPGRSVYLSISMYFLIGYVGVSMAQILGNLGLLPPSELLRSDQRINLFYLLFGGTLFKLLLLGMAMYSFIRGIHALHRQRPNPT